MDPPEAMISSSDRDLAIIYDVTFTHPVILEDLGAGRRRSDVLPV